MPEGDTIYRSARTLHRALAGKPVTRFETGYAKLACADDNYRIAGAVVERVEAHGKWLHMFFSGDLILLTHMLMNGSWHIYRTGERWRGARRDMRLVIETADWLAVAFTVPVAEFHSAASLQRKIAAVCARARFAARRLSTRKMRWRRFGTRWRRNCRGVAESACDGRNRQRLQIGNLFRVRSASISPRGDALVGPTRRNCAILRGGF